MVGKPRATVVERVSADEVDLRVHALGVSPSNRVAIDPGTELDLRSETPKP
ncbi:hypothetical protein [Nocardia aurea]|uniref:Uncharacterized protein n=1 Tax=Nocardia aurea TaxID=2144174 RepID=A0ABV3FLZ0_9NOCA